MKNKAVRLLISIVFLGAAIITLAVIMRSRESSRNTLPLNKAWSFWADGRILATPILIDNQIIFRTANKIYSINAVNGSMNWKIAARASDITINVNEIGKPIVGNSNFLVSEEQGNSIGIYSTKTGEKLWSADGQANDINALEIVDDIMIVARHDGNLVVYDLTSQEKLWEIALPPRSATPIAANSDWIIVGMKDVLRVYNLKDGRLLNEKAYNESLIIGIALSESGIFVGIADNGNYSVSALQPDSLNENWVFQAGEEISHPYLSVTSNRLSLFNKTLLLLDTDSGNLLWEGNIQEYYSAPVFHQNNFFFISKQKMFDKNRKMCKVEISKGTIEGCSVDRTGRVFETLQPPGPLIVNDLLIVPQSSKIVTFKIP